MEMEWLSKQSGLFKGSKEFDKYILLKLVTHKMVNDIDHHSLLDQSLAFITYLSPTK